MWNIKHICEERGMHKKLWLEYYKGKDNLGDPEVGDRYSLNE